MAKGKLHKVQLSKRKKRIFKIASILMALLILVLIEIGLQVFGYGKDYPLFIQSANDDSSLVINPEVAEKYFFNPEYATKGLPRLFDKVKNEDTFRIVIMGASTAVGYPYKYNGGFQNWLEYALKRTYPNQKFEIINTALTAINTYALLDFTEKIVDQNPDAVLIYAGHNEYYGALGIGSTSSYGNSPWVVNLMLSLREIRIVQLITNTMLSFRSEKSQKEALDKNLMEKMVDNQKIPIDSEDYQAGIDQYQSNLSELLTILGKENIPTFLSTIVSNEKDIKPFISDSTKQETSADYFFKTATNKFNKNKFQEAKSGFVKAKELDMLRFRAPEAINKIIHQQAKQRENVTLVDNKALFEEVAKHNIIGNNLLLEHVHPNLKGYALIGYSFYKALSDSNLLFEENNEPISLSQLRAEMPVTALDSLHGEFEIMMLKDGWPYFEPFPNLNVKNMSEPELISGELTANKISWKDATEKLFRYYLSSNDSLKALKVLEAMSLRFPDQAVCYSSPGHLALALKKYKKAKYLYSKAAELDSSQQTLALISQKLLEAELYQEAMYYLGKMENQKKNTGFAKRVSEVITNILRLKSDSLALENNVKLKIELAKNYMLLGKRERALRSLNSVLKNEPNNVEAKRLKQDIQN